MQILDPINFSDQINSSGRGDLTILCDTNIGILTSEDMIIKVKDLKNAENEVQYIDYSDELYAIASSQNFI